MENKVRPRYKSDQISRFVTPLLPTTPFRDLHIMAQQAHRMTNKVWVIRTMRPSKVGPSPNVPAPICDGTETGPLQSLGHVGRAKPRKRPKRPPMFAFTLDSPVTAHATHPPHVLTSGAKYLKLVRNRAPRLVGTGIQKVGRNGGIKAWRAFPRGPKIYQMLFNICSGLECSAICCIPEVSRSASDAGVCFLRSDRRNNEAQGAGSCSSLRSRNGATTRGLPRPHEPSPVSRLT